MCLEGDCAGKGHDGHTPGVTPRVASRDGTGLGCYRWSVDDSVEGSIQSEGCRQEQCWPAWTVLSSLMLGPVAAHGVHVDAHVDEAFCRVVKSIL